MPSIIDQIFTEVFLDKRVTTGIFSLEENAHMDALRDLLIEKGMTVSDAVGTTNKMLEGKYPERQAYNKDGILCTFPSPEYKSKAIKKGTHFEQNPNPQTTSQNPTEEPIEKPIPPLNGTSNPSNTQSTEEPVKNPNIFQNNIKLAIEPIGGDAINTPEPIPTPTQVGPLTPERNAATKQLVNQLINTNNVTSNILPLNLSENCKKQIKVLYNTANEMGLTDAIDFLSVYIK